MHKANKHKNESIKSCALKSTIVAPPCVYYTPEVDIIQLLICYPVFVRLSDFISLDWGVPQARTNGLKRAFNPMTRLSR